MDIAIYNDMLTSAHIASVLYKAEQDRANGVKGASPKEAFARMEQVFNAVMDNSKFIDNLVE